MILRPAASLFSLPLAPWQQPQSIRAAEYEPRKRRRKVDDWTSEGETGSETTDAGSGVERRSIRPSLVLFPEEAHQYRIAGQPLNEERPGGNFPHAAVTEDEVGRMTKVKISRELSSLVPPIYVPQSPAQIGDLRIRHLGVITTILHRCLLEGDYIRAGRAWGLILQEEFGSHPVDVRSGGRWGIGAEILLRRDFQLSQKSRGEDMKIQNATVDTNSWFTRKGFEDAKEYYEKLILQYPYRKAFPNTVSSLDFYPAMFALWVYVVQQESQLAQDAAQNQWEESSENSYNSEDSTSIFRSLAQRGKGRYEFIMMIRSKELKEAQQIAARMDELLVSPPYSDSTELLRLRGMLSIWIGDLLVLSVSPEDDAHSQSDQDPMSIDELAESIEIRRERRLAVEKRDVELEKSRRYLEKAELRTRGVAHSLENLHIRDGPYA